MGVQTASWSDRVTLPPHPASTAVARAFVQELLVEHDVLYLIDDVRLVTSELASNATQHANTPFTVMLEGLDSSVRLTVSDESSSTPIRAEMQATATAGRGMNIVHDYSRDWGVSHCRSNGKSVWASFALRSREGDQAPPVHGGSLRSSSADLASLLRDVKAGRVGLRTARAGPGLEPLLAGQKQLDAALKLYVDALGARNLPVPYLLRDELRLHAGTTTAYTPSRRGGLA
jgi:anti-sigma regulatory factor (Ser/Thr protein kinase)